MSQIETILEKLVALETGQASDRLALIEALNRLADSTQAPVMKPSEELENMLNLRLSQAVPRGTNMGHDSPRPKTAAEKVQEYLAANPSARHETARELAEKIGVGKSTVNRVLNGK